MNRPCIYFYMAEIEIHPLDFGKMTCDLNLLSEAQIVGVKGDPNPDIERVDIPVYGLIIDHPDATILWDTGSHPDAGDGHWPEETYAAFEHYNAAEHCLENELERAGYGFDDIDIVFMTHLHADHTGGLRHFDGTDVPVLVHESELKWAYYSAVSDEGGLGYILDDFHRDLNWEVVHQSEETHFDDITFLHLPGHTPGQMGTVVTIDGEVEIFASDQFNWRENFEDEIPPGPGLVWSQQHWFESLQKLKEMQRKLGANVYAGHGPDDWKTIQKKWG